MKSQNNGSFSCRILLLISYSCFWSTFCFGRNTITSTNFIKDGATIISNDNSFELGFFTPVNSTTRYVGIWFKRTFPQTVVWVANRDNPLNDTSGIFTISKDGNLVVLDGKNTIVWSANVVSSAATNTSARILDSGNLVLEETATKVRIWESFKHPSDKFLLSMKFITNTRTKEKVEFTSWNTPSDPSTGNFTIALEVLNIPEIVVWNGRNPSWRSGPWNGQSFIGIPEMNSIYLAGFNLVIEDQTYTLSVAYINQSHNFAYIFLTSQGNVEQTYWDFAEQRWKVFWSALETQCDFFGACGAFGICNEKTFPICNCLRGFKPKQEDEWNQGNWGGGCVRKTPLQCEMSKNTSTKEDGFLKVEMVKVPSFAEWSISSVSADDCKLECLANCSCSAYAYENGIGCMLWKSDVIDIQKFESGGADLYLRTAYADLDHLQTNNVKDKRAIIIAMPLLGTFLIVIVVIYFGWKWKTRRDKKRTPTSSEKEKILKLTRDDMIENEVKLDELPLYNFEKLAIATNHFDLSNKLGEGGFGPVYKGKLLNGEDIAVKRLSRASNQGYEEFINEVRVISKLQHRNLVRLHGCCIEGEEKMLIYEYMPNLSLDALIFDSTKQKLLDWRKRFNIIDGIARGLLYLHRDSRLRIIHRDLKASNILLDKDCNPKISDFGMARIFYSNKVQANTLRIVGTYGYMSPEYAMQGQFSEKSDVFSFGVLLLEIISGRRNTGFYHHEHALSLLEFAWKLWVEDNLNALIDPTIYELSYQSEILRCIQVGLLCVEESINDRPNISTIISMINSETVDLPIPKQPSFMGRQYDGSTRTSQQCSTNSITLTTVIGR